MYVNMDTLAPITAKDFDLIWRYGGKDAFGDDYYIFNRDDFEELLPIPETRNDNSFSIDDARRFVAIKDEIRTLMGGRQGLTLYGYELRIFRQVALLFDELKSLLGK